MNFNEAMQILGNKLQEKYGHLGFKYIINTRPYDPYGYAKPDINTQPLFYSLRDNEIYLDIGNEGKINNTFEIVCQWMDKLLIPKMNELCATE